MAAYQDPMQPYDRFDAFLHHIFRQTQGDAWFRPNETNISGGVCIRVSDCTVSPPEFRVFPYENASLEPFEAAVVRLNPAVAVKVRSAAVHAALSDIGPENKSVYVDANTRIQVLESMCMLHQAEKEQSAAFIRDEHVLVVWSDSLETIIPICADFDARLIRLLWRSRPKSASLSGHGVSGIPTTTSSSSAAVGTPATDTGSISVANEALFRHSRTASRLPTRPPSVDHGISDAFPSTLGRASTIPGADVEKGTPLAAALEYKLPPRTWYGRRKLRRARPASDHGDDDDDDVSDEKGGKGKANGRRKIALWAPIYNGLAAALALVFLGSGVRIIIMEILLDFKYNRLGLIALVPFLYCVSLFFALQIIQNVTMAIGPIAHYHSNSKYYSAQPPAPDDAIDNALPHVTIQMPVFKESLEVVLKSSIESIKKAMQTYARQGGTSTIFINDDGLRLLPPAQQDARIAFYATHNIGWVARPPHGDIGGRRDGRGFVRAGRFKKASNMNYALALSLKAERCLEQLMVEDAAKQQQREQQRQQLTGIANGGTTGRSAASQNGHQRTTSFGGGTKARGSWSAPSSVIGHGTPYRRTSIDAGVDLRTDGPDADADGEDETVEVSLEDRALQMAIEETWRESGRRWRPWAANGRSCRMGEVVLLVDSDTVVPEDCLRDAAREMAACPSVAIIQHESDVIQVANHYFENGIAYFTRRVNRCISMNCANGEVAPFVGHNAFMRWKALQEAALVDPVDGKQKVWSEGNVSEDFDMAMRLHANGYIIRWATYSKGTFKEGVSLTVDDELNRWQKYAYGCNELLLNPFKDWWRRGPIARRIRNFLWCDAPLHYKISILAYMFSYYGIAASVSIAIINYVLLGFQFPVDGFYFHSWEIYLASIVVFFGSGTVGYTLLQYRLGRKQLLEGLLENLMWIPFFFFFFGGLGIPLTQAILAHLFSYNIQWSATKKEVERSNFFKEVPKIMKRFWFPLTVSALLIVGMVICSTSLVPEAWRVTGAGWAVIVPLAVTAGSHILFPIVLNPWLMIFSY